MRNKLAFSILSMVLLFTLLHSTYAQQDTVIQKIIEIGKTDNQTMQHLDVLTNRIGGRLVGSSNYETAVDWAKMQFEEWGMDVAFHQT